MTIRNWLRFFFTTLALGGIVTPLFGFFIRWGEFKDYFINFDLSAIIATFIWFIFVGFLFSVVSQVGFFAYLMVNQLALGILRSYSLWNSIQVLLIAVTLFDLVYFRFERFAQPGESIVSYIAIASYVLFIGLIIAYVKTKQTKKKDVFIPTLFFMVVLTILEWVTVLRVDDRRWIYIMLFSLVINNIYQVLALPQYNARSEQERKQQAQRRAQEANNGKQQGRKKRGKAQQGNNDTTNKKTKKNK